MFVIVPESWKCPLPADVRVVRRGPVPADNHELVRSALSRGERLFVIGTEGVSRRNCFAVAEDHIALFGSSALAGPNRDELGPRFPSLMGMYLAPEGDWERGVIAGVPDWRLATPAERKLLGALAMVSRGIDEAEIAGHGGAKVLLLARCHGWDSVNIRHAPLSEAARAAGDLFNTMITEGGEEREL
ncbi:MAG: hypothetical protein R6U39_07625 [Candidatus Aegiribacteria sp.]